MIFHTIAEFVACCLVIVNIVFSCQDFLYYSTRWIIPNIILIMVFSCETGWISRMLKANQIVILGDISFEAFMLSGGIIRAFDTIMGDISPIFSIPYCLIITMILAYFVSGRSMGKMKLI